MSSPPTSPSAISGHRMSTATAAGVLRMIIPSAEPAQGHQRGRARRCRRSPASRWASRRGRWSAPVPRRWRCRRTADQPRRRVPRAAKSTAPTPWPRTTRSRRGRGRERGADRAEAELAGDARRRRRRRTSSTVTKDGAGEHSSSSSVVSCAVVAAGRSAVSSVTTSGNAMAMMPSTQFMVTVRSLIHLGPQQVDHAAPPGGATGSAERYSWAAAVAWRNASSSEPVCGDSSCSTMPGCAAISPTCAHSTPGPSSVVASIVVDRGAGLR